MLRKVAPVLVSSPIGCPLSFIIVCPVSTQTRPHTWSQEMTRATGHVTAQRTTDTGWGTWTQLVNTQPTRAVHAFHVPLSRRRQNARRLPESIGPQASSTLPVAAVMGRARGIMSCHGHHPPAHSPTALPLLSTRPCHRVDAPRTAVNPHRRVEPASCHPFACSRSCASALPLSPSPLRNLPLPLGPAAALRERPS